jgi:hypothetical protein
MSNYRSSAADFLFNRTDWFAVSEGQLNSMKGEIESQNSNELLNTSTNDLAKYYANKYSIEVPVLHTDQVVVDQQETQIDVSRDKNRWIEDRSRPFYITGTSIEVEVPFTGEREAFSIQPTTRNFNNPRAVVGNGILSFSIEGTGLEAGTVKSEIENSLESINQHLDWLRRDVKTLNDSLFARAQEHIERRKQKLLKDQNLVTGLGFRIKERPGAAKTYAAPQVKRVLRPQVAKPSAAREPYKPEPTLLTDDYEHILSVLDNMVTVMELSPGAFQKMDEETLRSHFLVQLNGQFSGGATGETFNYEGKTDILLKVDGRNIFIGESKFWTGEQGYSETLDQVLSYLSWRDTKAAVLVFNRNRDFSAVLQKIEDATPKHAGYKELIKKRSETSWSYLFGHKDDANREIMITVQAYNVPDRIEPRTQKA